MGACDEYVAAFVSPYRVLGLPLLSGPGLHGVLASKGRTRTRLLITDDRAVEQLAAVLPTARPGSMIVFAAAQRCIALVTRCPGWSGTTATAMVCRDLDEVPELAVPAGLEVKGVWRRPEDDADGISLSRAVAVAALADPSSVHDPSALVRHLEGLPPGYRLFAAVDGAGAVRATSGVGVFDGQARVLFVNTDAAWRRRGVGSALTAVALRAGRDAGARRASLNATDAGVPIYRRLGFDVVAAAREFSAEA